MIRDWNVEHKELWFAKTPRGTSLFIGFVSSLIGLSGLIEEEPLFPPPLMIGIGVSFLILVPVMDNAHANYLAKTSAREKLMTRASADSVFRYYWFRKMCEEKDLFVSFYFDPSDYYSSVRRIESIYSDDVEIFLNEYLLWERLEPSVRNQADHEYKKQKKKRDKQMKKAAREWKTTFDQQLQQEKKKSNRSRRIQQRVKDKVWRRDEGKCVKCGSRERLEYDHIIPFSKGGSNTARNIELLCEKCNRRKGSKI